MSDDNGQLALFIRVRTKPGQRDALRALWETHLKPRAASNPSQTHYVYAYDGADPDVIMMAEVYDDPSAVEANANSRWFADYMAAAAPLIEGAPEVVSGPTIWAK